MWFRGFVLAVGSLTLACSDKGLDAACSDSCVTSSNCDSASICENSCCTPFSGCTATSCANNEFCDADYSCKSVAQKCAEAPCECRVVGITGQTLLDRPTLYFAAGQTHNVQVAWSLQGGAALAPASVTLSLSSNSAFTVQNDQLVAQTGAGSAVLTVTGPQGVQCHADLLNLGAASPGSVRYFVYDDLSGAPVAGARLVIDANNDGQDDNGSPNLSNASGWVEISAPLSNYAVTVFAAAYDYFSAVGLDPAQSDLAIPLSARKSPPTTGAFTGRVDFSSYEKISGTAQDTPLAMIGSSLALSSLNLNLNTLLGPPNNADCSATPNAPGCYSIGFFGQTLHTALPGGLVLGLPSQPIKEHFETVGQPGRRYAWSFAVQLQFAEFLPLILQSMSLFGCACDATSSCDLEGGVNCACDTDCGLNLDFAAILAKLTPLFPRFATGLQGNLPLAEAPMSGSAVAWDHYIATAYANRPADARFPRLDSGVGGGYPSLRYTEVWRQFADTTLPALPSDPAFPGRTLEAMVVLTGVQSTGSGFVPLGAGVGLDCTQGNCLDRAAGTYDGIINASQVCVYHPDPRQNACKGGLLPPNGQVADGHMGVSWAAAFAGLEYQPWLTLTVSLPLSSAADTVAGTRATAFINRSAAMPTTGATDQSSRSFPAFAALPSATTGRVYTASGLSTDYIQAVTLASDSDAAGVSTHWQLYFAGAGGSFYAPVVPPGRPDPFAAGTAGGAGLGKVDVTHVALRFPNVVVLSTLLSAQSQERLSDLAKNSDGLSLYRKFVDP